MQNEYNYNADLLHELDRLDLPAAPLSGDEFDRILAAARDRLPRGKAVPAARPAFPACRPLRALGRAVAGLAACAVLLCGVNAVAPALAEELPLVGGAFAWVNRNANARLRSEQLDSYAESIGAPATAAATPYTITLSQAYFDGEWLRLSVVLDAAGGSLAAFDEIMPVRPEQRTNPNAWPDDREGYGDLTLADGTLLGNEGLPVFTRQGADTFVMELRYPVFLQPDPAALAGQELTLVLRDLVAYNVENRVDDYDENGFGGSRWDMTNETDLPGVYTMSFTVPAVSESGIRTATGQDAASGVTVDALRATPAATKLVVTTPNDPPAGAEPADHVTPYSTDEFVLRTDTGELLKLERAEGEPVDETGGAYRYTAYFDAVPEDAASVTLTVLRGGETFATLPLPLSETTE